MKRFLVRSFLLLFGWLSGLVLGEVSLRILKPPAAEGGIQQKLFPVGQLTDYEPDDECGYLPKIGPGGYSAQGCLPNDYPLKKTPGRQRILFVGDSVTHRAKIIDSLRKLYGDAGYEYWNAGVESFNTVQEVALYRRDNRVIKPDLVVVTFHNNDFMQTPLVYRENGKLNLLTPLHDRQHINTFLFEYSWIYRYYVGQSWAADQEEKAVRVHQALAELKQMVERDGGRLKIVLLPLMKPLANYDQGENWSREHALAILKELRLEWIDLAPTLEEMARQNQPLEETKGDYWHPNQQVADRFARFLHQQQLF